MLGFLLPGILVQNTHRLASQGGGDEHIYSHGSAIADRVSTYSHGYAKE